MSLCFLLGCKFGSCGSSYFISLYVDIKNQFGRSLTTLSLPTSSSGTEPTVENCLSAKSEERTSPLVSRFAAYESTGEQSSTFTDVRIIWTAKLYPMRAKMESMYSCAARNICLKMHLMASTVEITRSE